MSMMSATSRRMARTISKLSTFSWNGQRQMPSSSSMFGLCIVPSMGSGRLVVAAPMRVCGATAVRGAKDVAVLGGELVHGAVRFPLVVPLLQPVHVVVALVRARLMQHMLQGRADAFAELGGHAILWQGQDAIAFRFERVDVECLTGHDW